MIFLFVSFVTATLHLTNTFVISSWRWRDILNDFTSTTLWQYRTYIYFSYISVYIYIYIYILYKYISVKASLSICHVWFIWNMRSWIALKFFKTLFWIKCCGHLPPFGSGVNWFREIVAPYLYIISPSCSMLFYCMYWSIIKLSNNHFLQTYYY